MLSTLYRLLVQFPVLIFSITVHEYFHGLVAEKRGDDTPRLYGRLTLNPLAHIDFVGTLLLPIIAILTGAPVFGWAKPVPINPYRLNNPKRDMMFVGLAGPLSNLTVAISSAILIRLLKVFGLLGVVEQAAELFLILIYLNVLLCVFNLIPVPPLDGSRILSGLLPPRMSYEYDKLTPYGFFIVILLLWSGILGVIFNVVVYPIAAFLIGN